MTEDLGRTERHAHEIAAIARAIQDRIHDSLNTLKAYRRGFPTGADGTGDTTSRTEALAIAGPDAIDREIHQLATSLDRALRELNVAYNITARYGRAQRARVPIGNPQADTLDGWCTSCLRDGGYLEPVWDGRYTDRCRWCGEFKASEHIDPPLPLLKARHAGKRITAAMVESELRRVGRKTAAS